LLVTSHPTYHGCFRPRECFRSSNVYVETLAEVTPAGGFPRTVQLKLRRPGVYQIVAADRLASAGDCAGKGNTTITVKRHPEFPCSLYPGFKRDSSTDRRHDLPQLLRLRVRLPAAGVHAGQIDRHRPDRLLLKVPVHVETLRSESSTSRSDRSLLS
jgi:hypothetical protein